MDPIATARCIISVAAIAFLVLPSVCQAESNQFTNEDLVRMVRSGASNDLVIAKIKSSYETLDTSPTGLEVLAERRVPEKILMAVAEVVDREGLHVDKSLRTSTPDQLSAESEQLKSRCAQCLRLLFVNVAPESASFTYNALTPEQLKFFLQEKQRAIETGWQRFPLVLTKYLENADYIVLHDEASGFRSFIRVREDSGSSDDSGSPWRLREGDVTTGIQRSEVAANEESVDLVVLDARTGKVVYRTHHSGGYAWNKPEKKCVDDALRWLRRMALLLPAS